MEENKNLEEKQSEEVTVDEAMEEAVLEENSTTEANMDDESTKEESSEEKEEEYYFTAAELRKQQKRREKRLKRVAKEEKYRNRNVARMYKSSAVIAVFAGIMQIIMGLPREDGMTNIMLGATFICFGYLFYSMGQKADKDKKRQEENR